jgi:hypothetical protein
MAARKSKKPAAPTAPPAPEAAKKKFERDLMIRGDAAPLDEKGKLPLDATHEIVKEKNEKGETEEKIVRRRFKLF